MKSLRKIWKKWKHLPRSCIGRFNVDRENDYLTINNLYTLRNHNQNTHDTLPRNIKVILKFIYNQKIPWISKTIIVPRKNTGGVSILDFKIHYRVVIIKIVWYWHKRDIKTSRQNWRLKHTSHFIDRYSWFLWCLVDSKIYFKISHVLIFVMIFVSC